MDQDDTPSKEIMNEADPMIIETGDGNDKNGQAWFSEIVGLPQYIENFVLNGYDSICMIKEINEEDQRYVDRNTY